MSDPIGLNINAIVSFSSRSIPRDLLLSRWWESDLLLRWLSVHWQAESFGIVEAGDEGKGGGLEVDLTFFAGTRDFSSIEIVQVASRARTIVKRAEPFAAARSRDLEQQGR
jgi:hypothetical protein